MGKHQDKNIKSPSKLYCEPIYPDLTTIGSDLPANVVQDDGIPDSDLTAGNNMNFTISDETLIKYGHSDVVAQKAANAETEKKRYESFDFDTHRNAIKTPSAGKPANNNDPFPIDIKIEELEMHQPRVKIEQISNVCPEAVSTANACVQLSIDTERRLVKLENNLATIMRYLARLSSRIPINCIYYGGQTVYEKYKCIRCLNDNRIGDGQLVTLDQCLNCTRYEPLIGQTYEILNNEGINLSHILDDCQMSYSTMSEYCNFADSKKYQEKMKNASLDSKNTKIRNANETDLYEKWGQGIAMNWELSPVEDQIPHISYQEQQRVLDSYYGSAINNGTEYGNVAGTAYSNRIIYNKKLMDQAYEEISSSTSEDGTIRKHVACTFIEEAKEYVDNNKEKFLSDMKAYLSKNITDYILNNKECEGLDNILVAAITLCTNIEAPKVASNLLSKQKELKTYGIDNIILTLTCLDVDSKYIIGKDINTPEDLTFPRRLDKVTKLIESTDAEGMSTVTEVGFNLNWGQVDDWDWINYIEPLEINYTSNQSEPTKLSNIFRNFVYTVYTYNMLMEECSFSSYDHNGFAFPIAEQDLGKVFYTSPFGQRWGTIHRGVDLAGDIGIPIHAIADGTVAYAWSASDGNGGGNRCCIQHANNISSAYMHMNSLEVYTGQNISKGQIIGYIGCTGHCEPAGPSGAHLHFQIQDGGITSQYSKDPTLYFPRLRAVTIGDSLSNSK